MAGADNSIGAEPVRPHACGRHFPSLLTRVIAHGNADLNDLPAIGSAWLHSARPHFGRVARVAAESREQALLPRPRALDLPERSAPAGLRGAGQSLCSRPCAERARFPGFGGTWATSARGRPDLLSFL